ncbi:MAG: DUF2961 domain-containing protein [Clostridia bacterium]|nr:DUF2961 domain-containing protein [Clostridia bacterium]
MISGLHNSLSNLHRLSDAKTRSVSPENFTGEKGKGGMATEGASSNDARDLGQGWKVSPKVWVQPGEEFTLADIEGPGAIQHIWLTLGRLKGKDVWRDFIFRIYWEDQEFPSVEVPAGDFFANGWNEYAHVNSLAVCTNPARGFNCYWTMPFRKRARLTMENRNPEPLIVYYQIDYALSDVDEDIAYFCASFRRSNPTVDGIHTVIDGIEGKGHYVGTYMAWQVNSNNWWGEGELKFFMDGDTEFPTICGTGTEDYFCGAYNFDVAAHYVEFSTAYAGMPQVIRPDGLYRANTRFGLYRWHITDPIRFEKDLRITVQDLGLRGIKGIDRRFLKAQSDISSVAYWYQTLPHKPLAPLGDRDELEVI